MSTKIPWADKTWNPIIGCSKCSTGCLNCYAERMAKRQKAMGTRGYRDVVDENGWTGETAFIESELKKPYRWKKHHQKIFVCSMSDLFHEATLDKWLNAVFHTIEENPQHIFQILTKRPGNAFEYLKYKTAGFATLPNIWLGVTAENQEQADKRIPVLLEIPAAIRFLSIEPMLGPIDLRGIKGPGGSYYQVLGPITCSGDANRPAIDWIIVGGESGPGARPMNPEWVYHVRDQCMRANVPFFFKQWGGRAEGRMLDGREWGEFPKANQCQPHAWGWQ